MRRLGRRLAEGFSLGFLSFAYWALGDMQPAIRYCKQWNIRPDDSALGLHLIEDICLGEETAWSPDRFFAEAESEAIWIGIGRAIAHQDQQRTEALFQKAQRVYTPAGNEIRARGFGR